ncbi:MAG: hypothetical protein CMO16_07245 [Thaumarchaeota archaeon]|nr:hypothetical protein [Nitrososphaerota archaeon]|tara:strand:+ start:130 stop:534 length:405 start_codon:yes stop_codon:yes gene_type:complete
MSFIDDEEDNGEDPRKMKKIRFPEETKKEMKDTPNDTNDVFMTKAEYMIDWLNNRKNAWKATGIIFIFLFFISLGVIAFLGLYLENRCNELYAVVGLVDSAVGWLGLSASNIFEASSLGEFFDDPCPNLILNWP